MKNIYQNIVICFLVLSIIWLAGCAVNAATGERHLSLISESQEIQMGKESDQQIVASMGLYNDPDVQKYVENVGMRLASRSERPNLPWTFRVIDDPVVNAFAIPGGFIYITRGILAHLSSEAQLAGVMGHEIGHVTAQHSVNQMTTQQLTQLGLGIGMVLKPELQQYGQLASMGLGVLFLKFSRGDESQADALGVRYSYRVGDDPHELISVMTMLDHVTQAGGQRIPEWLSTHPDPGNRKENIQLNIDTIHGGFGGKKIDSDTYFKHIDGIIFGDNPRDGFYRGTTFFQPDIKFTFTFPAGWQTANQRQTVQAMSPNKDAVIQIALSDKKSATEAVQKFASQQGYALDPQKSGLVHGFTSRSAGFIATTSDQTKVQGHASFIEYNGMVFQILGYSTQTGWSGYKTAVEQSVTSFDKLIDQKLLNCQPMRLKLVKLDRAMTLEQFNQKNPSSIPMQTLSIINQADPGELLKAGQVVKRIIGEKVE
jgi:predicted Zn-dependent protease